MDSNHVMRTCLILFPPRVTPMQHVFSWPFFSLFSSGLFRFTPFVSSISPNWWIWERRLHQEVTFSGCWRHSRMSPCSRDQFTREGVPLSLVCTERRVRAFVTSLMTFYCVARSLRKCGQCKFVWYCSRECQVRNGLKIKIFWWASHSDFLKIIFVKQIYFLCFFWFNLLTTPPVMF